MAVVRGSMRRALSPEIQHSSPRARSPAGRSTGDTRSAVSTRRVSAGADLGPGARVRSPEGRSAVPAGGVGRSGGAAGTGYASTNARHGPVPAGDRVVEEIAKIGANREQRRRHAEETRRTRQEEAQILESQCCGRAADVEFHRMIRDFREQMPDAQTLQPLKPPSDGLGCIVCVRKRPVQPRETSAHELDCVTACHPRCVVHERKFKVDGITKYLDSQAFEFDHVFGESNTTEQVYTTMGKPLVPWVLGNGGRVTLFAYGQTGSGKTHTMMGLQRLLSEDLFEQLGNFQGKTRSEDHLKVIVSFFEIYGGQPYDLLNNRQRLEVLEDARSEVQVAGLAEREVLGASAMLQCIEHGTALRTTHATSMNEYSSRSHAIINVSIREASGIPRGRITLVDLAGSERAGESKSSVRQRRVEGAQINRSLLALKECIRAMTSAAQTGAHVPYRASKLTLVLRDAFNQKGPALTVMIACVSPGISDANHSVNTLRYSARLKDRPHTADSKGDATPSEIRGARSSRTGGASRQRSPSATGEGRIGGAVNAQLSAIRAHQQQVANDDGQPRGRPASQSPPRTREVHSRYALEQPSGIQPPVETAPVSAWHDQQVEALSGVQTQLDNDKVRNAANSRHEPRRGRQPTFRDRQGGRFERAEAPSIKQDKDDSIPAVPAAAPTLPTAVAVSRDRSGSESALLGEDDRYLHSALTAEVATRDSLGESPLDVGVEDLADLAHLEALEEVRRLNDQVAAQHVAALQEDARLLSAESELLSRVHQDETYDIDQYVKELDDVVRRKLQVYGSLLNTLEVLKSRLKVEESLTQHSAKARQNVVVASCYDSVSGRSPR